MLPFVGLATVADKLILKRQTEAEEQIWRGLSFSAPYLLPGLPRQIVKYNMPAYEFSPAAPELANV